MSIKILVVDDNADILANVAEYLEMKGWAVECSLTSADAWERVHRVHIDLMILDIGLPGMDGLTLCRRLRAEGKTLPILMLTARDAIDDRVEGLMGFFCHFQFFFPCHAVSSQDVFMFGRHDAGFRGVGPNFFAADDQRNFYCGVVLTVEFSLQCSTFSRSRKVAVKRFVLRLRDDKVCIAHSSQHPFDLYFRRYPSPVTFILLNFSRFVNHQYHKLRRTDFRCFGNPAEPGALSSENV